MKTFTSKKGNAVELRYPKKEDFEDVWQYACDLAAEDTTVELMEPPTREEERDWFDTMMDDIVKGNKIHLQVLVNGKYAGSGELRRGRGRRKHVADVGLSLAPQFRSEGIGTELLKELIAEGRAAGLRMLTLSCFETNAAALHVYEKLGFKKAGVIPGAIAYKDGYVGEVKLYLVL